MGECYICGKWGTESHHIVFRSECKPLEHCKKNQVDLCVEHHRGTHGVHGTYGDIIDTSLKNEFVTWLESSFTKEWYKAEEIQKILGISERSTNRLLKRVKHKCYLYNREDIITACMGG